MRRCLIFLAILPLCLCSKLYELDWTLCPALEERKCYIDSACDAQSVAGSDNLALLDDSANLKTPCAIKYGIQTKAYSKSELLIIMLWTVNDKVDKTKTHSLMLYQVEKELFGCKLENGKLQIAGEKNYLKEHKIELYDVSHWEEKNIVCAVLFRNLEKATETFKQAEKLGKTKLRYFEDAGAAHLLEKEFKNSQPEIFTSPKPATCNPNDLEEITESENLHVLRIPDKARKIVNCDGIGDVKYSLYKQDNSLELIKEVQCNINANGDSVYRTVKDDGSTVDIGDQDSFNFFCGVKIDKMCVKSNCTDADCPTFTAGTDAAPATLTCKDAKWLIDGVYHVGNQPSCKANENKVNEAAFFLKFANGAEEMLKGSAKCFDKYECSKKSQLDISDCKEKNCGAVKKDDLTIECVDGRLVKVQIRSTNSVMNATKFTCDTSDGRWKDPNQNEIPDGSYVFCEGEMKQEEVKYGAAEARNTIIGMAAGGVALVIAATVIGFICIKRYVGKSGVTNKNWSKMDYEKRIKTANSTYDKIFKAGYANAKVADGFKFIEKLLDYDEQHPHVWAPVFSFLVRFQAVTMQYSAPLHEAFTLFCLTKVVTIIDRVGWKSDHPLSNDNFDGYIRVVALKLLGYALQARDNNAAKIKLAQVLTELKFLGDQQYPTCGVVWSLASQFRINYLTDGTQTYDFADIFEPLQLVMEVYENFPRMPEIAEFGQVEDQARAALIHGVHFRYAFEEKETLFKDPATVKYLLKAYTDRVYPFPDRYLLMSYTDAKGKDKPDEMPNFLKLVPEPHLSEILKDTIRTMIYCGRTVDAKKLQIRCKLENVELKEYFTMIKSEQRRFEEIVLEENVELQKMLKGKMEESKVLKSTLENEKQPLITNKEGEKQA